MGSAGHDLRAQLVYGLLAASGDLRRWRDIARIIAQDPAATADDLREVLHALAVCSETTEHLCRVAVAALLAADAPPEME